MSQRRESINTSEIGMPISSCIPREPGRKSGAASGNPLHSLTRITARIRVIDSCFADGGELIRVYLMASGRKGLPLAAVRSEAIDPSRKSSTPFAVTYEAATLPSGRAFALLGLKGGSMKRRPGMTLPARNFQLSCERATGTYRCGCALGNFG